MNWPTTRSGTSPTSITGPRRTIAAGLPERLVIDASHGNCAKDHERQRTVVTEISSQVRAGSTAIRGIMLESFLLAGRQDVVAGQGVTRGRSVTDACMSWSVTAEALTELAAATRARRRPRGRAAIAVPEPRTASAGTGSTPVATAVALVRAGIFDTYVVYERAGVWTVAGGSQADITMDADHIRVRHQGVDHSRPCRSQPLVRLGEALAELPIPGWTAYGWLTFEVAHLLNGRRDLAGFGELVHLIVPRAEVRIDHAGVTLTCADPQLRDRVREVLATSVPEPPPLPRTTDIDLDGEWYQRGVADAVREIQHGTFRKVILSRAVPVEAEIDFPSTYLLGRAANTPARSFLLDIGGRRATGFCPETILEVGADGIVSTQPLAGTRSLGGSREEDLRLRAELLDDPKEIYEHIISVKLATTNSPVSARRDRWWSTT